MKNLRNVLLIVALFVFIFPAQAQDDLEPSVVEIEAEDGLMLIGDWYTTGEEAPAVLLLHMLRSNRTSWEPLIPVLVNDYGFHVLNIDLRGHGETRGATNWELAEQDVQTALDWLREQDSVNSERIAIVGASIGSSLAIRGWANDEGVVTAVALSPGISYRGLDTLEPIASNAERPVLLIAARQDSVSASAVIELFGETSGDVSVRLFEGSRHGTEFLRTSTLTPTTALIGEWLAEHLNVEED